ncbi:zinc-ribbon domain-containing protein [Pelagibacterales bacterium SAG-MED39]|nr:zinc-ribbon domain-containing protein [Pelagibacterales bacterium SAG-MED39]
MIIICPCGEKKFEIDENLIPEKGRLLQCGPCNQTWFFNKKNQQKTNFNNDLIDKKETTQNQDHETEEIINNNIPIKKEKFDQNDKALVKYQKTNKFTLSSFFSYFLVLIITFIALIILLDTLEGALIKLFPNLELILFNLFESFKDLSLFIIDLR